MPIYQHRKDIHLDNPQKTSWLNLLPPLEGKRVLKFGTDKIENINNLTKCNCESITCIGSGQKFPYYRRLTYCDSIESLGEDKYDVCIIDEIAFLSSSPFGKTIKEKLEQTYHLLNENGICLVGFPNGLTNWRTKRAIKKHIASVGFPDIDISICISSFDDPIFIYPFSSHPKHTIRVLSEDLFKNRKWKNFVKDFIKLLLIKTTFTLNPLFGLVLIARKSKDGNHDESLESVLKINKDGKNDTDNKKIYTIWIAKPYAGKQFALIFNIEDNGSKLVAICKRSNLQNHRAIKIKHEYNVLSLLSLHANIFKKNKVLLPHPISLSVDKERITSIESAVKGIPISYSGLPLLSKRIDLHDEMLSLRNILKELVPIQSFIQEYLTKTFIDKLPKISERYFANVLNISLPAFKNNDRILYYQEFVQHGDFTFVNILFNDDEKKWGVFDWETLASGYPPVFDLFHLFTSAGFRETNIGKEKMFEKKFKSFVETFFQKNWFSNFVRASIEKYCETYNIRIEKTYEYFLDHLLFIYNTYRLDCNLPQFEKLYQDMLIYTLEKRRQFVLK